MLNQALRAIAMRVPAIRKVVDERDALMREIAELQRRHSDPHFVTEYTEVVRNLMATHPIDEAMSIAVGGGDYDEMGKVGAAVVMSCGLADHDRLIDLGCGCGRLAKQLGIAFPHLQYTGIDVVQELLDYAATKCPRHFRFVLNHGIGLPCGDSSADFVVAFSVFTHLYHEESYAYLRDIRRVLRPGGKVIFSFLESDRNWPIFEAALAEVDAPRNRVLTMFMERSQVTAWAAHLDMDEQFDPGPSLGHPVAVLCKRHK